MLDICTEWCFSCECGTSSQNAQQECCRTFARCAFTDILPHGATKQSHQHIAWCVGPRDLHRLFPALLSEPLSGFRGVLRIAGCQRWPDPVVVVVVCWKRLCRTRLPRDPWLGPLCRDERSPPHGQLLQTVRIVEVLLSWLPTSSSGSPPGSASRTGSLSAQTGNTRGLFLVWNLLGVMSCWNYNFVMKATRCLSGSRTGERRTLFAGS